MNGNRDIKPMSWARKSEIAERADTLEARAEAKKEATVQEALGQAEAILKIQKANADGIRMLKEAGADEAVLKIKSLEAFEKVADGKATTILLPAELQGIASVAATLKETAKEEEKAQLAHIRDLKKRLKEYTR
mgnify:CR=1 FL=1